MKQNVTRMCDKSRSIDETDPEGVPFLIYLES